jgi:hypothetical protein
MPAPRSAMRCLEKAATVSHSACTSGPRPSLALSTLLHSTCLPLETLTAAVTTSRPRPRTKLPPLLLVLLPAAAAGRPASRWAAALGLLHAARRCAGPVRPRCCVLCRAVACVRACMTAGRKMHPSTAAARGGLKVSAS